MNNPRLANSLAIASRRKLQRELCAGCVYVIRSGDYVKIGVAKDIQQRLDLMQVGNPIELHLLKSWECFEPYEVEEMLHCRFEMFRVRGEWFKLPSDVILHLLATDHPSARLDQR